ncbi:hypothetical protein LPA44_14095 [Halobacterium sp. KA-4]|uniref:DUF7269 family protein n=1 Tax=Halobacterium sp. KA-4 TaxID=2896367 RepID=UPI001E565E44|nr:hypothetical protein [Halobacterium sp. KA-4]MCD2201015.1 hypothetical protein [Halobacterium sp. KA-4]
MRSRTLVSGGLGVLALGFGFIYTFEPDAATHLPGLPLVETTLQDADPNLLLTGVGGALILYALLGAWAGGTTPTRNPASTSRYANAQELPPERVIDDDRTSVNDIVDTELDATELTEAEATAARHLLRDTTQAMVATTSETPEDVLAEGAWTDTHLAAAFLSDVDDVEQTVWSRLRLWLDPERERARRVRVTAREVEAFAADLAQEDAQ